MSSGSAATANVVLGGGRSDEEKLFDRQVRLWGSHGQRCLRKSSVLFLGSGATISEVQKNLVITGIGSYTTVDDAVVEPRDVGNNFYVSADDATAGSVPRAASVSRFLDGLNPDVRKRIVTVPSLPGFVADVVNAHHGARAACDDGSALSSPADLTQYSLIVADRARFASAQLAALDAAARAAGVPVLAVATTGLVGGWRASYPPRAVLESHPENVGNRQDLALASAQLGLFPELVRFAFDPRFDVLDLPSPMNAADRAATAAAAGTDDAVATVTAAAAAAAISADTDAAPLSPTGVADFAALSPDQLLQLHSRVPFPVILVRALYRYTNTPSPAAALAASASSASAYDVPDATALPAAPPALAPAQAAAFAKYVTDWAWFPPSSDLAEENFQEAAAHARQMATPHAYHRLFTEILNDPRARACSSATATLPGVSLPATATAIATLAATSTGADADAAAAVAASASDATDTALLPFWLLTSALRAFLLSPSAGCGHLPLSAAIPDMAAHTSHYVALKRVYKSKADRDAAAFERILRETVAAYVTGHAAVLSAADIEWAAEDGYGRFLAAAGALWDVPDPVRYFVAHCKDARVSVARTLADELIPPALAAAAAAAAAGAGADAAPLFASPVAVPTAQQLAALTAAGAGAAAAVGTSSTSESVFASQTGYARGLAAHNEDQDDDGLLQKVPYNTQWYVAIRALGLFFDAHGRLPGQQPRAGAAAGTTAGADWETDRDRMSALHTALHAYFFGPDASAAKLYAQCAAELAREGSEEVHTVAAVVGGMAADAAVKLLIRQYTMANNTVLYNGLYGLGSVFEV